MVESDARFAESGYANPGVLVSTDWVAEHLSDPQVRIVESDEDVLLYDLGHIPGAVNIDWHIDLQNPVERDFLDKAGFEALLSRHGIGNDTTVVFYGDRNNWYATYAYWLFRYFGHTDARVMNGGRARWEAEGRPMTREVPSYPAVPYAAQEPDERIRAFRDDVLAQVKAGARRWSMCGPPASHRRSAAHGRLPAGGRTARRPREGRAEHPVVPGRQRGRHFQEPRRNCGRSTRARTSRQTRM
ncbi:MAG: rhodanese-like domain-containing protein [Thermomicrobiales bacterium]